MQSESGKYRYLELSIFSGAFVFGIVMSSLGSILPALFAAIGFEKADAGRLFLVMNFAMLISSLVFGPICDRFGFRTLLVVSTFLVGGAFGWLSGAGSYGHILAALAVLGLGGGALNGGTNALINDISPDRRQSALNLLGIFFGCGALFTPFLIGALLETLGLRPILFCLVALSLPPFLLFLCARFPAPKHAGGFVTSELRALVRNPLLLFFGLLLLFESGNEFTMGGWVSTYLGERFHLGGGFAAYVLAAYWAAMMLGRLAVTRFGSKTSSAGLVLGSSVLALAACIGLILTGHWAAASVFVALTGLGFAAIFPTTLAQAGAAFSDYSGTAFSVIFVMALSGGMSAPWLVGRIAQAHGVGAGFWVTAASCAAIATLQAVIWKQRRGD